ncbi:MAG: ATP synthase F1 subunit epsilon [Oscillospiraceae bacterium]|nr:ATP synthase F1 subunit epsilon [Oscillospiraceae bacterium]
MDNRDNITENTAAEKKVRLRVITPMRTVYDKMVELVIARTSEGDMGVMYDHDKRSALLGDGVLRIFEDTKQRDEELFMILGGVFTVDSNNVTVTSEIAEPPGKIQEFLAQQAEERKASEIADQMTELHTKRMELAIRQALVHIDVSTYPIINKPEKPAES